MTEPDAFQKSPEFHNFPYGVHAMAVAPELTSAVCAVKFADNEMEHSTSAITSCFCGCATCVCSAQVIRTELAVWSDSVAAAQKAETTKGEQLTMPGDVSSTDVVSSGFSGWGSQASLKPAEVALIGTNNPSTQFHFLRDAITSESLRAEIKSVDAKVTGVASQLTASEARNMQQQIDQLRSDKTNGLLSQILAAVSKTPAA